MTTEEQGFLRSILSDPADDTHRLVYADWLEEHGRPERAEFIRVQCELAFHAEYETCEGCLMARDDARRLIEVGTVDGVECEYHKRIRRREWELMLSPGRLAAWAGDEFRTLTLDRIAERWLYGRRELPDSPIVWRRGFVAEVTCSAEDWLAHADALYWHPDQRVECPECVTDPPVGWYYANGCPVCNGSGRVERPLPPTAQPLERLTLTTFPTWTHTPGGIFLQAGGVRVGPVPDSGPVPTADDAHYMLTPIFRYLWPGLAVEFPPGGAPVPPEFTPERLFPRDQYAPWRAAGSPE